MQEDSRIDDTEETEHAEQNEGREIQEEQEMEEGHRTSTPILIRNRDMVVPEIDYCRTSIEISNFRAAAHLRLRLCRTSCSRVGRVWLQAATVFSPCLLFERQIFLFILFYYNFFRRTVNLAAIPHHRLLRVPHLEWSVSVRRSDPRTTSVKPHRQMRSSQRRLRVRANTRMRRRLARNERFDNSISLFNIPSYFIRWRCCFDCVNCQRRRASMHRSSDVPCAGKPSASISPNMSMLLVFILNRLETKLQPKKNIYNAKNIVGKESFPKIFHPISNIERLEDILILPIENTFTYF